MFERIKSIIEAKINKVLSAFEDPREQLDYAYEKMLQQLHDVDLSLTRALTARKKLEFRRDRLKEKIGKYEEQAKKALEIGRKDLAQNAVQRKVVLAIEKEKIDREIEEMKKDEEKLKEAREALKNRVDIFAARKERLKAEYETAEAQKEIKETLTGLSSEVANVGASVRRAEEKIEEMKARASAIDELIATGGVIDYLDTEERDVIEKELEKERIEIETKRELERLEKGE